MSGNFGGNSIPTTAIDGHVLLSGASTTYKDWKCSKVIYNRGGSNFSYKGVIVLPNGSATGTWIDFDMNPSYIDGPLAVDGFTVFCYPCSCEDPVTSPVVITSGDTNYQNYGPNNKPIIIGGGGLNS